MDGDLVGMASEVTGTSIVIHAAVVVVPNVEGSPGVAASFSGRRAPLAALGHLIRLALLVLGLEVDHALRLGKPDAEELVVQLTPATGVRLHSGLGPIKGPNFRERDVQEGLGGDIWVLANDVALGDAPPPQ